VKVPCDECIVKVRCMQRVDIKKSHSHYMVIAAILLPLVKECEELRKYFGIDSIFYKLKLENNFYPVDLLLALPNSEQLMDELLKCMQRPTVSLRQRVSIKNVRKKQ
jgi:hypothetical protein